MNLRRIVAILPFIMAGGVVLARVADGMGRTALHYGLLIVAGIAFWILIARYYLHLIAVVRHDVSTQAADNGISPIHMWGRLLQKSLLYVILPAAVITILLLAGAYAYLSLRQ